MILSWVLRGQFEKKNNNFTLCLSFSSSFGPCCPHGHFLPAVISRVEPSCNLIRISIEPWDVQMGSHYAWREDFAIISLLSVAFSTKQTSFHPRHHSEGRLCCLALTRVHPPPPAAPDRPINASEAFIVFGGVCEISAVWGDSCSCLHRWGRDSRCARLIEAKTLSPTSEEREDGGVLGVRVGAGLVLPLFNVMQNAPVWVEASNVLLQEVEPLPC